MCQFFNLSHPFIQKSFNLIPTPEHPFITVEDLQQVLPIFPNNGVLLVNATRWKELNVSSFARSDLCDVSSSLLLIIVTERLRLITTEKISATSSIPKWSMF